MSRKTVITIGQGEMSGVFNRAFLRMGHPVYPTLRGDDLNAIAKQEEDPELVLIAVGEADLQSVISELPPIWNDRVVLLQNELLPKDWENSPLQSPTIISVWFEKKKGQEYKVIVPSPIHGPKATLIKDALIQLEIPSWTVESDDELLFELVRKNIYILTSNIVGLTLPEGTTVGELNDMHQPFQQAVCSEILEIQYALIGKRLDSTALIESMVVAFKGDLNHKCMGRSAPARLKRALELAQTQCIDVPELNKIANTL